LICAVVLIRGSNLDAMVSQGGVCLTLGVYRHRIVWIKEMDEDERDEDKSYELTQIQFSLIAGTGIVFPPTPEYLDVARALMQLPNPKAGHNVWLFDDPRLISNNIPINGQAHDTMLMWHHHQPDLPANLQFVSSFYGMGRPWKHLAGQDLATYGAADVDACQRILQQLPDQMRRRGICSP